MELFSCPECGYENPKGSVSCKRCLLIFEKYAKKHAQKNAGAGAQLPVSQKLEDQWKDVLTEYDNKDKHEKFISDSLSTKNLQFASQQYRKMLDLNPSDEMAKKMIEKIIQVATLTYVPPARTEPPKNSRWLTYSILTMIVVFVMGVIMIVMMRR